MASGEKLQDMPPPGGYRPINYARVPAKTYFSGYTMILGYFGITAGAIFLYFLNYKKVKQEDIEMRSSKLALYPLLLAERDREYLKQLRRNRDEEAKLMENVEGWQVGTWYGEPIYKTLPEDTLVKPLFQEYYVHSSFRDYAKRANLKLWS
ncbi:NADH dehydrogenase [ubiquinone] 1 alpha subcomplex subunit 13 [Anabrus simplex]|uniref:NADH dehydrogenase [ubiquinone] 1 alpha subcomplex subunit 13 n=1 Tax=Anabrus simplex TaxID=316456 RepID=UPI0034DCD78C